MFEKGAGRPDKVLERPWQGGDGITEKPGHARQTEAACNDQARKRPPMIMEEVLRRENMLKAFQQVKQNGGAPGIDGIKVEKLAQVLTERWPQIREELLNDQYLPQPVRKVEIPKPGGRGMMTEGVVSARTEGTPQGGPLTAPSYPIPSLARRNVTSH
jgi:retron-type reverse transcriptase